MKVEPQTIKGLDAFLKEHLEADVVTIIAGELGLSAQDALDVYFNSHIAAMIERGEYGVQYLSPEYLAKEILDSRVPAR